MGKTMQLLNRLLFARTRMLCGQERQTLCDKEFLAMFFVCNMDL
jgi:hypothetical protein